MRASVRALIAVAAALLGAALADAMLTLRAQLPALPPADVLLLMLLSGAALLLELRPTRLSFGHERAEVTLTSVLFMPIFLIYGWPYVLLATAFSVLVADLHLGKPWYKALYNTANIGLSFWLAGRVYYLLIGPVAFQNALPYSLFAACLAALLFAILNSFLVASVLAASQGLPLAAVLGPYARVVAPFFTAILTISVLAIALWQVHPAASLLLLPSLAATKRSHDQYVQLRTETDRFLHSLADAVDLRDPYTAQHSQRVAELCVALASKLGVAGRALWDLEAVARVHDVGKISVPDAVLLKTGTLTSEEYHIMKQHVEAGVRILQHVSLYRDALDILAQHHERLDGSGYPQGLKGDEIIFPARILAMADAYDAMTTDRPYRPAKSPEEAVQELYRVAGKEYDLNVVRALEDELIARGVLKGPVIPAALEAVSLAQPPQQTYAAPGAARVVPLPRVGSGRKPS